MKNVLAFGAGVQSTTVLRMSIRGDLPKLDLAIFADTGWEPAAVLEHCKALTVEAAAAGIPVLTLSGDNIREMSLSARGKNHPDGRKSVPSIPYHTVMPNGDRGMIPRQCTGAYKIQPVERMMRAFVNPPKRPDGILCRQWFGISVDESQRARVNNFEWAENYYPLIEMRMTRAGCLRWNEERGYAPPPRSACLGCPYKRNSEWAELKKDPAAWNDVVEFDRAIRNYCGMKGEMYLHNSCRPIDQIDFRSDIERGQGEISFNEECTGMCGN